MSSAGAKDNADNADTSEENSDEKLLEQLRRGGGAAARMLFERYGDAVNRVVWRMTGADSDHDDLVQEALFAILRDVHQVRSGDKLRGWVMRVTTNTVYDWMRKRAVRRRYDAGDRPPEDFAGVTGDPHARMLLARVTAVVAQLKPEHRLAFSLRHIEQMPLAEVADACGCSLATVKRRIQRAEKRFAVLIGKESSLAELVQGSRWESAA